MTSYSNSHRYHNQPQLSIWHYTTRDSHTNDNIRHLITQSLTVTLQWQYATYNNHLLSQCNYNIRHPKWRLRNHGLPHQWQYSTFNLNHEMSNSNDNTQYIALIIDFHISMTTPNIPLNNREMSHFNGSMQHPTKNNGLSHPNWQHSKSHYTVMKYHTPMTASNIPVISWTVTSNWQHQTSH